MAESIKTKKALAQALKKLLTEKDFEKISIGEICDECDMSRKSFYYHFRDKYELVIWIFRTEFWDKLRARTDGGFLESLSRLAKYFYTNKDFYKPILAVSGQNSFSEYFSELCRDSFEKRIREQLDEIVINDLDVGIYSDFFVHTIKRWLTANDSRDDATFVRDLGNSIIFGKEVIGAIIEQKSRSSRAVKAQKSD